MKIFPTPSRLPALKLLCGIGFGIIAAHFIAIDFLVIGIFVVVVVIFCVIQRRFSGGFITLLYWFCTIICGYLIGASARGALPPEYAALRNTLFPEIPATMRGEIIEIQKRDTNLVRCIVAGTLDPKILPPVQCRVALTLYNAHHRQDTLQTGHLVFVHGKTRKPREAFTSLDFPETLYYASINVQWLFSANAADLGVVEQRYNIRTLAEWCAIDLQKRIVRLFPADTAPFAIALITGNRNLLSKETRNEYVKAGTAHILAISGLHISFFLVLLLIPLNLISSLTLRFLIAVLIIVGYVFITGASASALRAGVMIILFLVIHYAERDSTPINILAFTVILLLAIEPHLLYSTGLWLSVSAVAGISLFYPVFTAFFQRIFYGNEDDIVRNWLANSIAITFASSSLLVILVAYHFSTFSLISPVSNLAVVPLSSGAFLYTVCALLSSYIPIAGEYTATLFASAADFLFRLMNTTNHFSASVPFAALSGSIAIPVALLYSVASLYCAFSETLRLLLFRICVVVCVVVSCWYILSPTPENNIVRIFPCRQVVGALIPVANHKTVVVLQDRKNDAFPVIDPGLLRLLEQYHDQTDDSLYIIANGSTSVYQCSGLSGRIPFRLVVTSLHYQQPRFFAALDTLERHHIEVRNGYQKFIKDSTIMIRSGVRWNVWNNTLFLPNISIELPQYSAKETVISIAHQPEKP